MLFDHFHGGHAVDLLLEGRVSGVSILPNGQAQEVPVTLEAIG